MPTTALQSPWVGSALNWRGHPYAQLQCANSRPLIIQVASGIGIPVSERGMQESTIEFAGTEAAVAPTCFRLEADARQHAPWLPEPSPDRFRSEPTRHAGPS